MVSPIPLSVSRSAKDRAAVRNRVLIRGMDTEGGTIYGEAKSVGWTSETDRPIVFQERKVAAVSTLNNIAASKLAMLERESRGVVLTYSIVDGNLFSVGDTVPLNRPDLDLVGNFKIWKITKKIDITEVEVDVPEEILERVLFDAQSLEDIGIYFTQGVKIGQGTSFPASPKASDLFYRTDENILYRYTGTTWQRVVQVSGQGTSFPASPQIGDLFYRTDTNELYRWNGSVWHTVHQISTSGTVFPTSPTIGDFFYKTDSYTLYRYNGSAWVETLRVTQSGTNLPASGRFVGDLFYSTNYEQTFYWTGSSWIPLATIARSGTSFPTDKATGDIFLRTDELKFYRWSGTEWVFITSPLALTMYEVNEAPMTMNADTTELSDSTATKGKCAQRLSAAPSAPMFWGPYKKVGTGSFYAIFMLKVGSNASSSDVLQIDVNSNSGGGILASYTLKPNMFKSSLKWEAFALRFEARDNITDYEFRGVNFVTGVTDVYADWIGVQPANVPLAVQNTTCLDSTQNTTAGAATQNTTAGDATQNTSAQSSYMASTQLMNLGAGSDVEVTNSGFATLRSGSCGSEANAMNLALIIVSITRGSSGGYGNVRIKVNYTYDYSERTVYISGDISSERFHLLVPSNLSGAGIIVYAKKDGTGSVYLNASVEVWQYRTHTHGMTNPSHSTSATNPSHATGVTNPPHSTASVNPDHKH